VGHPGSDSSKGLVLIFLGGSFKKFGKGKDTIGCWRGVTARRGSLVSFWFWTGILIGIWIFLWKLSLARPWLTATGTFLHLEHSWSNAHDRPRFVWDLAFYLCSQTFFVFLGL
jgi:hypothetical protein